MTLLVLFIYLFLLILWIISQSFIIFFNITKVLIKFIITIVIFLCPYMKISIKYSFVILKYGIITLIIPFFIHVFIPIIEKIVIIFKYALPLLKSSGKRVLFFLCTYFLKCTTYCIFSIIPILLVLINVFIKYIIPITVTTLKYFKIALIAAIKGIIEFVTLIIQLYHHYQYPPLL